MTIKSQRLGEDVDKHLETELDEIHKNINDIQSRQESRLSGDIIVKQDSDFILVRDEGSTVTLPKFPKRKAAVTVKDLSGKAATSNITIKGTIDKSEGDSITSNFGVKRYVWIFQEDSWFTV